MVAFGECNSCQMGDHKGHVKDYSPAPPGMMGGFMCPCEGECEDHGPITMFDQPRNATSELVAYLNKKGL